MEWSLWLVSVALLVIGLVGQAFEMRKIRLASYLEGELVSPNVFTNKRNFKWYALIGLGIALIYVAERI